MNNPEFHNPRDRFSPVARGAAAVALITALVLTAACSCGRDTNKKPEEKEPLGAAGIVIQSDGDADLRFAGKDEWLSAARGSSIFDGDSIYAPAGSRITLLFEGSRVHMEEGAYASIEGLPGEGGAIRVARGKLGVWTSSGLCTSSPAAAVKTDGGGDGFYLVRVLPGGGTTVECSSGEVRIENDSGGLRVGRGEAAFCEVGATPVAGAGPGGRVSGPKMESFYELVRLQEQDYFEDELSRDNTADEAEARLGVEPGDGWSRVNLGRVLTDRGDLPAAKSEFERALSVDPQFSQAFAGLGKIALREESWREAVDHYTRARRAERDSIDAVFGLGQAALGGGLLKDAGKWYKEALGLGLENEKALVGLALTSILEGEFEEAAGDLKDALEASPDCPVASFLMAAISTIEGDAEAVGKQLEESLESREDAKILDSLGIHEVRTGLLEKAASRFLGLVDLDDQKAKSWGYENLAVVEKKRGRLSESAESIQKAVDLDPGRASISIDAGQIRLAMSEEGAALEAFGGAGAADPQFFLPHQWIARTLLDTGNLQGAAVQGEASIALNPSDWVSHIVLGIVACETAGPREVAGRFEKGRKMAPGQLSPSEMVLLGRSYGCEGDSEKALELFERAAGDAPGEGTYHLYLGEKLLEMERRDEALAEFETALQIDPALFAARVSLAGIYVSRSDYYEASAQLERALESEPGDVEARLMLARCTLEDGRPEDSFEHIEQVLSSPAVEAGLRAEAFVIRGNAHDRSQDFHSAIQDYTSAVSLDGGRGDAWFYLAGDLERTGRMAEAAEAYQRAFDECRDREEWKEYYAESAEKLNRLR